MTVIKQTYGCTSVLGRKSLDTIITSWLAKPTLPLGVLLLL